MKIRMTKHVRLRSIGPEISVVISIIASIRRKGTFWITAIRNGKHMAGSKHVPANNPDRKVQALDGDCLSTQKNLRVYEDLKQAIGPSYDILLEDYKQNNEHIHVEFDPDFEEEASSEFT